MAEEKLKLADLSWEPADDIVDRCMIQGCRTPKATWYAVHLVETDHGPMFPSFVLCDRHYETIMQEKAVEKAKRPRP